MIFTFFKKRKERIKSLKSEYTRKGRNVREAFTEQEYVNWYLYDQRYLNEWYLYASKMDSEEDKRRAINDESKLSWLILNGFVNDFDNNRVNINGNIQTLCWYNPLNKLFTTRSYVENNSIDDLNEWLKGKIKY